MSRSLSVPNSLLYYNAFLARKSNVSASEMTRYEQIYKGYLGEKRFREILERYDSSKVYPLYNLWFDINGSEFQIDAILFTSHTIYLLEIKNFTGDYVIEESKIYSLQSRTQIYNPVNQLERTEYLFQRLLKQFNYSAKISSHVVFINDHFWLYGATINSPFIFSPQIESFVKKIYNNSRPLPQRMYMLAEKLSKLDNQKSIYDRFPNMKKADIKRGLFCIHCFQSLKRKNLFKFDCKQCDISYDLDEVVLQAISQFYILFPKERITVGKVSDWCNYEISRKTIVRILKTYLDIHRKGSYTSYSWKESFNPIMFLANYLEEKAKEDLIVEFQAVQSI